MRKTYRIILKKYFHGRLLYIRTVKGITQSEMAERLAMDERSYIDLDHGRSCCSATTLALFLAYVCEDVQGFVEGLRNAFGSGTDWAA